MASERHAWVADLALRNRIFKHALHQRAQAVEVSTAHSAQRTKPKRMESSCFQNCTITITNGALKFCVTWRSAIADTKKQRFVSFVRAMCGVSMGGVSRVYGRCVI